MKLLEEEDPITRTLRDAPAVAGLLWWSGFLGISTRELRRAIEDGDLPTIQRKAKTRGSRHHLLREDIGNWLRTLRREAV